MLPRLESPRISDIIHSDNVPPECTHIFNELPFVIFKLACVSGEFVRHRLRRVHFGGILGRIMVLTGRRSTARQKDGDCASLDYRRCQFH